MRRVGWLMIGCVVGCDAPAPVVAEQVKPPAPVVRTGKPPSASTIEVGPPVAEVPVKPAWERLLDASNRWFTDRGFDPPGRARAEAAAHAAIRALAPDDPTFVTAQCRLAEAVRGGDAETALLAAIARLRAAPLDDPYASLDRLDHMVTELHAAPLDGKFNVELRTLGASTDACKRPDLAVVTTALIDSYWSWGMFKQGFSDSPPPNKPDAMRAASALYLQFYDELARALGPGHPRTATLVERLWSMCHRADRAKQPKACVSEAKAHAQALAVRVATFGEDHPATRASLLRVAADQLAAGKQAEGEALLVRASAGELSTREMATAATALAMRRHDAGNYDEAFELLARVEACGERCYGIDTWSHMTALRLYSDALKARQRYPEAVRVFKRWIAIQPQAKGDAQPVAWPGYAELLALAGARDEAIAAYGVRLADATSMEQTGANAPARQTGRDTRLATLRSRSELRRAGGDVAGADADMATVRDIEAGPPVAPDP